MKRRYMPATPLSGKLPKKFASVQGKLPEEEKVKVDDDAMLKELYTKIGSKLNQLLYNFAIGDIAAVKSELDTNYTSLSITIRTNSKPDMLYYEITRLLYGKVLDGLKQSIRQYLEYTDVITKLENCINYKSILDDPVRLTEYLNQLNQQKYLFDVEPITVMKTMLKPEYAEYIKLYGFPEGGIFNSDLLGDIIYKLQNSIQIVSTNTTN